MIQIKATPIAPETTSNKYKNIIVVNNIIDYCKIQDDTIKQATALAIEIVFNLPLCSSTNDKIINIIEINNMFMNLSKQVHKSDKKMGDDTKSSN